MRLFFVFWLFLIFLDSSSARADIRAIVEHFSSEGCFVDPETDQVLLDVYENETDVLVLSCMEQPESESSLSESFAPISVCGDRHYRYSHWSDEVLISSSLVMVNGRYDVDAEYPNTVRSAIEAAKVIDSPVWFDLVFEEKGFRADLPNLRQGEEGIALELFLLVYEPGVSQGQESGFYSFNIVQDIRKLGDWDGRAQSFAIAWDDELTGKSVLLMAQDSPQGAVRALGQLEDF